MPSFVILAAIAPTLRVANVHTLSSQNLCLTYSFYKLNYSLDHGLC